MKKLFFILLLLPLGIVAQKQGKLYIDSLLHELSKVKEDTGKVIILNNLALSYGPIDIKEATRYGKYAQDLSEKLKWKKGSATALSTIGFIYVYKMSLDTALDYCTRGLALSELLGDQLLIGNALYALGICYMADFKNDKAEPCFQKALEICKKEDDKLLLGNLYSAMGTIAYYASDQTKALDYYHKSLKIGEEINNSMVLANSYGGIGNLYFLYDGKKAVENYEKAIEHFAKADDYGDVAVDLSNIGLIYTNQSAYEKALNYHQKALSIYRQIGSAVGEGAALGNIGFVYDSMHNYTKALEYYQKGLASDEKSPDGKNTSIIDYLICIGGVYIKMHDSDLVKIGLNKTMSYQKALECANRGLQMAREIPVIDKQSDAWQLLNKIYEKQRDYTKAYEAYKNFIVFRDSSTNAEKNLEITRKDMQFGFDRKQLADSLKNEEIKTLARLKYEKQQTFQQWIIFSAFAALVTAFIIGWIIFRSSRKEKKANQLLQTKNDEIEKQKNSLELALGDLKATQTQLIQSEKMASLGELTAGIAHEIQNPLNFVNNFSEVSNELIDEMNAELSKGNYDDAKHIAEDVKQNLEKINYHGKRADGIVKGMLQHSRSSSGQKEPTDINVLCDEYLRLSYHGLRAKDQSFNATIKTDFDGSIAKVNMIPQDIGRVILNLLTNAFYVVNEKKKQATDDYEPTVTIKTSLSPKSSGRNAEIRVIDNGNGIPQKVRDKIFQPFFTTKPTGQGTGLGLSLSYDIVKAHGGELKVETMEGRGTTFIISLPT